MQIPRPVGSALPVRRKARAPPDPAFAGDRAVPLDSG